jgi:hypothetical protein
MKRLLLITDLPSGTSETAVDGIFRGEMRRYFEVNVVFHDAAARTPRRLDDTFVIPKAALRGGVKAALAGLADPASHDFVIVRNKYHVLRTLVGDSRRGRLGFWETFPHSYRRLAEAEQERRAVWRKRLEYAWRRWSEARLLQRVDFFLPITARHHREFHPEVNAPTAPLPMGVDETLFVKQPKPVGQGPVRFVYAGTIDRLRRLEEVDAAFRATRGDFQLDYYTFSHNATVGALKRGGDPRIRVRPAVPRPELLEAMRTAEVGLGYVPPVRTYIGSSPTKTVEYAALGLMVMANPLPDYADWLEPTAALFTAFEPAAIREGLGRVLAMPRSALAESGRVAARAARERRSYRALAAGLARFLEAL